MTGYPGGDVVNHLKGEYVSVYVPTTPNPTSGFFLMMPKSDVIELDMSVDAALKYIISMGVVTPGNGKKHPATARSGIAEYSSLRQFCQSHVRRKNLILYLSSDFRHLHAH